jgi:hypothetical protein
VAGLLYWSSIDKTRHSATNELATPSSGVDHTWYKAELHCDEIQSAQELEGQRTRWLLEKGF